MDGVVVQIIIHEFFITNEICKKNSHAKLVSWKNAKIDLRETKAVFVDRKRSKRITLYGVLNPHFFKI
jgi:hypothetical protein